MVNCLNEMRTRLLSEDKYSDPVDELLLKVIDAPTKKIRVIYKEGWEMQKHIVDEKTGIPYTLIGDYYFPNAPSDS